MKHASWLSQKPLPGMTPFAEECLAKMRAMLPAPKAPPPKADEAAERVVEREPGEDWEENENSKY